MDTDMFAELFAGLQPMGEPAVPSTATTVVPEASAAGTGGTGGTLARLKRSLPAYTMPAAIFSIGCIVVLMLVRRWRSRSRTKPLRNVMTMPKSIASFSNPVITPLPAAPPPAPAALQLPDKKYATEAYEQEDVVDIEGPVPIVMDVEEPEDEAPEPRVSEEDPRVKAYIAEREASWKQWENQYKPILSTESVVV